MKYKLLVLDLDGTLTNSKKELPEENRTAIINAQKKGYKIALASGRPTFGIAPMAEELNISNYGGFVLAYNGGLTMEWGTNHIVQERIVPQHLFADIYDESKRNKMGLLTYESDCIITETPDNKYVQKEVFLNRAKVKKIDNLLAHLTFDVPKFLMVGEPEKLHNVELEMCEKHKDTLSIFRSEPYFLEIVPKGIDKASSLNKLSEYSGIKKEEMIAVGDGFNDIPMIDYAGLGVAMTNAQDEVKKVSDYITAKTNDECGVAEVIYKFMK